MTVVFPLLSSPTHSTIASVFFQPSHRASLSSKPMPIFTAPFSWPARRSNVSARSYVRLFILFPARRIRAHAQYSNLGRVVAHAKIIHPFVLIDQTATVTPSFCFSTVRVSFPCSPTYLVHPLKWIDSLYYLFFPGLHSVEERRCLSRYAHRL